MEGRVGLLLLVTADILLARQAYDHWVLILDTIAKAPNAADLQHGFDDYTTATCRSDNVLHLAKYRADYEDQYVRDMLAVVRSLNPTYDAQVLRGGVTKLPKSEQAALVTFFASPEWTAAFIALLAHRGGTGVIPTDAGKLAVILRKAHLFKAAYEALGISMFCDGSRPNLKKKNDYNDIHQALYVNEFSSDLLVTDDGGVASKVGVPLRKVITHATFLQREAT